MRAFAISGLAHLRAHCTRVLSASHMRHAYTRGPNSPTGKAIYRPSNTAHECTRSHCMNASDQTAFGLGLIGSLSLQQFSLHPREITNDTILRARKNKYSAAKNNSCIINKISSVSVADKTSALKMAQHTSTHKQIRTKRAANMFARYGLYQTILHRTRIQHPIE